MKLIKMQRDGHMVDVHPEMEADYKAAGYRAIEADAESLDPIKRRGRPPKSE